jgi:hypothetical protein
MEKPELKAGRWPMDRELESFGPMDTWHGLKIS